MFYQEENDRSCLKDFMFFIAELVPIAYKAVCSGISNMFNFVKNTLTKSKKPRGLENPETEEITKLKNAGPSQSPARRCGLIRMLYTYCFKYWKNQKPKIEPERLGTYSKTIQHLSQRITVSGTGDPFCLSLNLNFYDIETQINDCFEVWRFVYDGVCLRQTLQLKKGTRELVGLNIVLQYLTESESSQKSKLSDDTEVYKYLIDNYKRAKKYLEANLNIREFNFDSIYIADLIQ
ncbi:hypothetical protein CDIK_0298 [Cucumispora dikerogammari]|nr:hypothetical protein CDIK_0298 [Cucumispora dikerogammari]